MRLPSRPEWTEAGETSRTRAERASSCRPDAGICIDGNDDGEAICISGTKSIVLLLLLLLLLVVVVVVLLLILHVCS